MTTINTTSPDLAALQGQLVDRLAQLRRRVRAQLLLEGAARVLLVAMGLAVLSFILDRVFRLGLGSRVVFALLGVAVVSREAFRHLVRPLRMPLDPVGLAGALDRRTATGVPPLAPRVADVLQLPDLLAGARPPSEPMIRRAVHRSYASLAEVDFDARLDHRRRRVATAVIACVVLLPALLATAFPSIASLWARRWLLGSGQAWPQQTYLSVVGLDGDGRLLVPRGEPSVFRVGVRGGSVDPGNVSLGLRVGRGRTTPASMTRFGPGDYRFDLPPLQNEATVELAGGDDELGPIRIEPVDRPRVVELALSSQHPTQKASEVRKFSGVDADMAFLPKTRLELTLTANVPVAEVRAKSSMPSPGPADVRRLSDRSFALAWTHETPVQLSFELVGMVGGLTSVPTPVSVGLKVDQAPRVTLQYTGVRQRVTPQVRIPLNVQSRDDYGLATVDLATRIEATVAGDGPATQPATQPSTAPAAREGAVALFGPADPAVQVESQQKHEFDAAAEKLSPGALLSFTGRATDARYTGPQTGLSRTVTFRVVPPEELFREILLRQQAERARFRKAIAESEKLRADLIALAAPETAAALARQQRAVQREVSRIATALGESVTEMRLNALGGQEAWDLMDNGILKPLRELNDGLMTEQRDALDALGRGVEPQKLSEATTRQEQVVAKMNDILKQMSQWDSFVDVINQLNEIIRLQDNVRRNTEQMKEKQTEGVFE